MLSILSGLISLAINLNFKVMFDQLQSVFSGELYFENKGLDAAIKTVYATDASEYQEKPLAVAIPKTIADIKALIAFATEKKNITDSKGCWYFPGRPGCGQRYGCGYLQAFYSHPRTQ